MKNLITALVPRNFLFLLGAGSEILFERYKMWAVSSAKIIRLQSWAQ